MQDLLLAAARAFESYYFLLLPAMVLLAVYKMKSARVLLLAVVVAGLVGLALKPVIAQDRPCNLGEPSLVECLKDYGMPSTHAATSSALAVATLGTPLFFIFAPIAVLVAYSRVYLGVHTLEQVAAGVALGVAAYSFARVIEKMLPRPRGREVKAGLWGKKRSGRAAGRGGSRK